jgi:hypothetical protein
MTNIPDYITAHKFSSNHKAQILKDEKCGCFYCHAIFNPQKIEEWVEDISGTAICPYCGIDSIIGESSGFPITDEFLRKMSEYWF